MKNEFSKRLKELRTSLSLTQSEFASIIGTSQNALSNYEKGERNPSYEIIWQSPNNLKSLLTGFLV